MPPYHTPGIHPYHTPGTPPLHPPPGYTSSNVEQPASCCGTTPWAQSGRIAWVGSFLRAQTRRSVSLLILPRAELLRLPARELL